MGPSLHSLVRPGQGSNPQPANFKTDSTDHSSTICTSHQILHICTLHSVPALMHPPSDRVATTCFFSLSTTNQDAALTMKLFVFPPKSCLFSRALLSSHDCEIATKESFLVTAGLRFPLLGESYKEWTQRIKPSKKSYSVCSKINSRSSCKEPIKSA